MLYQLPNGKVISMSIEQYLQLDLEEIQFLISLDCGTIINNPFSGSSITRPTNYYDPDLDEIVNDNEDIEAVEDLIVDDTELLEDFNPLE
jgi:hypothetical protein